jgi:hypothetical protein
MTDLTEANLKAAITEIYKHIEEMGQSMTFKPTKVMYVPDDLAAIGLTHEDVVNMVKEKNN